MPSAATREKSAVHSKRSAWPRKRPHKDTSFRTRAARASRGHATSGEGEGRSTIQPIHAPQGPALSPRVSESLSPHENRWRRRRPRRPSARRSARYSRRPGVVPMRAAAHRDDLVAVRRAGAQVTPGREGHWAARVEVLSWDGVYLVMLESECELLFAVASRARLSSITSSCSAHPLSELRTQRADDPRTGAGRRCWPSSGGSLVHLRGQTPSSKQETSKPSSSSSTSGTVPAGPSGRTRRRRPARERISSSDASRRDTKRAERRGRKTAQQALSSETLSQRQVY